MRHIGAAVVIAGLSPGCGGKESPTEPTTTPTITLGAQTTAAPLNASIPITATVRSTRGTLADDVVVHFVTTFGALSAWDAPTKNGVATTMLATGSVPGTAEITAAIGADAATPLRITIGGGVTPSSLQLSPPEARLPSTGGSVVFTAYASADLFGLRLLEGVLVTFTTTAGTLSNASATTNNLGRAHTTLTTSETAVVTASVAGATSGPLAKTSGVPVVPRPTVTITVSPVSTAAGEAISASIVARPAPGQAEPTAFIVWGDGRRDIAGGLSFRDTTQSHGYATPGEYLITGTASGAPGEVVSTAPLRVTIGPQRRIGLVFDYFTFSREGGPEHTFTIFPRRAANPTAVRIEFGDGTSRAIDPALPETMVAKLYCVTGPYTVRAIQTNADGATESASVDIVARGYCG